VVRAAVALLLLIVVVSAAARAEARFALLIGNQSYDPSVGVLRNPHNDIALVGEALKKQGFELFGLVLRGAQHIRKWRGDVTLAANPSGTCCRL
jgi:hypothetical protein